MSANGDHDASDPFFKEPPLGGEGVGAIDVADTDSILGEALWSERTDR
jgi:hypothetical protein